MQTFESIMCCASDMKYKQADYATVVQWLQAHVIMICQHGILTNMLCHSSRHTGPPQKHFRQKQPLQYFAVLSPHTLHLSCTQVFLPVYFLWLIIELHS